MSFLSIQQTLQEIKSPSPNSSIQALVSRQQYFVLNTGITLIVCVRHRGGETNRRCSATLTRDSNTSGTRFGYVGHHEFPLFVQHSSDYESNLGSTTKAKLTQFPFMTALVCRRSVRHYCTRKWPRGLARRIEITYKWPCSLH